MDKARRNPWVGIAIIAGLLGVAVAQHLSARSPAPPEVPRPTTVAELLGAYQRNEVAADLEWRGHAVLVAAVVVDVRKSITDKPYVMLGTKRGDFNGVQCLLVPGQEGRVATFDKGDHVTFRGRVGGFSVGSVMLDDCAWVN